ncbi:SGNH/GDSL hydrolase family protein [Streptomyces chattanoogensis]|uniref:SGNH/GDSL hydrolase family protein n=1 Tax=Streptomyces chattanoogensis TaxID=66876 RepID=UPI0036C54CFD
MRGRPLPRRSLLAGGASLGFLGAAPAFAAADPAAPAAGARHWVGGWAAALTPPGRRGRSLHGFARRTLRLVVHLSVGGDRIRLRLSNLYGTRPLDLGAVTVARRGKGAATEPGTGRRVTFAGRRSATVPVGADVVSDPVHLTVHADGDLVVSIHLPTATGPTTWHGGAKQTSYLSTRGDHTADESGSAFHRRLLSWFYLAGVDVATTDADRTVVAFGDSLTEGGSIPDNVNLRWPDVLARRLARAGRRGPGLSVVNAGIGGNRLLSDVGTGADGRIHLGVNAQARFTRDVLQQTAVSDAIVLIGTNDLGAGAGVHRGARLTSGQVIAGLAALANRAHAAGIALHAGTIIPNARLHPAGERMRAHVNHWIRSGGAFDSVVDFDAALRDPEAPRQLRPRYNSGDGVHPNTAGMHAMAQAVDLSVLGRAGTYLLPVTGSGASDGRRAPAPQPGQHSPG